MWGDRKLGKFLKRGSPLPLAEMNMYIYIYAQTPLMNYLGGGVTIYVLCFPLLGDAFGARKLGKFRTGKALKTCWLRLFSF